MGIEQEGTSIRHVKQEKIAAPPGFASLTSFTLKRVEYSEKTLKSKALVNIHESGFAQLDKKPLETSLEQRMWIVYDEASHIPEKCDNEQINVVTARLDTKEEFSAVLGEAPCFYPTEEEFEDTLKYISDIQTRAESYGICRIRPPLSWQPPCLLMENNRRESLKFTAHIQRIKKFESLNLKRKAEENNEKMDNGKRRKIGSDQTAPCVECFEFKTGPDFTLETFKIYADKFKEQFFHSEGKKSTVSEHNKSMLKNHWEPSVENIEGEYRRIIRNPTGEIEEIYGADVESGILGSGFPVASSSAERSEQLKYEKSGWNLNNIPKLPGSLLALESNTSSSCFLSRLSIGMCFSSHCWRVEEHHLYSLCYMHFGDPRIWYGIPGRYYIKFKTVMKKYFPDLPAQSPDTLHEMIAHISPFVLKFEGIPVYRCVHYPREFVLIFPGAYHSGFSCGFNCTEKAQFAPIDWLPHGQNVVELYGQLCKKTLISHDKLLFGAATEAVRAQWEISLIKKNSEDNERWRAFCGKDGILAKALKSRIKQEAIRREYLCNSSQARKMEVDFDSTVKRECCICFYDIYFSASGCPCSPEKYTCLQHSKQLCSCAWSSRFFLFRYTIGELNVLLEALEGRLSAVYRWAKVHLGLEMSSYTLKD